MSSNISSSKSQAKEVEIPLTADNYTVVYDGQGSVDFNAGDITMSPKASTATNETHAALVVLKTTEDTPVKDFELTLDMEVTQQLRQNSAANDWEVFWLFFNYNGTPTEKTSNYFITKPANGSELGLAHGELGQKFLNTDSAATTAIGSRHVYKFIHQGNEFTVLKDGAAFYSVTTSSSFPNKLYSQKGQIGFYSEDATVKIYSVTFKNLDTAATASAIAPILAATTLIQTPLSPTPLAVSVTNSTTVGSLFWSCNYKKLQGDFTSSNITDCLNLANFDNSGGLLWSPTSTDIGAYLFNYEVSEARGGFAKQSYYTQVRPTWSANPMFLFDSAFSITKTVNSQSRAITRDLASENNKTDAWPDLISTTTLDLSGLFETSPWVTDTDTSLAALHFDANHDINGLPFTLTDLNSTQDIRLSYWFKRDNNDSKAALALDHGNGTLESRHWFGVISSRYTDGGSEVTCDDPNAATNDWMFVTTQVSAGVLKTFVNGRQVCSQNLPMTYAFVSPLKIAPKVQTFFAFAGRLSEIAGYKTSTTDEIYLDFLNTAERYRKYKIGKITTSNLVLHWDMANADGMSPAPSASVNRIAELATTNFSKFIGGFDGTASSGYDTSTPKQSALVFDGNDDWVQVVADSHLSLGTTWTIEAWLKPGVAKGNDTNYPSNDLRYPLFKSIVEQTNFDNGNKLSHGFGLRLGTTNTVDAYVVNNYGFTDTVAGVATLNANQWYHVAASFNKADSTLKTYVNGVLDSSKVIDYKQDSSYNPQTDGDVISGLHDTWVGIPSDTDTRRRFNGSLGALRIYSDTLSATQIKANCQAQQARYGVTCP